MRHAFIIRLIHWSLFFCMLLAYASGYYRYWYTTQSEPANWYLLVVHMNIGALLFILSFIGLFHLISRPGKITTQLSGFQISDSQLTFRQNLLSKSMHYTLYLMLLIIPLSGYLGSGFDFPLLGQVNLSGFFRFEIIQLWLDKNLDRSMIEFTRPFAYFHRDLSVDRILPLLLFGHIGATLYHQLIKRDNLFRKIWFK